MEHLFDLFQNWLLELGIDSTWATLLREVLVGLFILVLAIIGFFITKGLLIKAIHIIIKKTKNKWDDKLIEEKIFTRLAYLAPALIINFLAAHYFSQYEIAVYIISLVVYIYMVIIVLHVIIALTNVFYIIYSAQDIAKTKPIRGYIQVVKIVVYILAGIVIISILLGKNNFGWLAGFGAFSAILLLVFKDTILGFVGGIQLSANNMVKVGDWIEMDKFGANGTVIDISLTSVKVQNWDKTITTVPTYALVTDYFINWRGMEESGGRRIKRSINIDMNSIKFCTPEMLERFKKFQHVAEYVKKTEKEVEAFNKKYNIDNSILVNGRRQTNIGIFRAYLKGYLHRDPNISDNMTFLVRQLQQSEKGLPIQIYVFSKVQDWSPYEDIQSDIFDHILAVIPEFDLKVFQTPSGTDFKDALTLKKQIIWQKFISRRYSNFVSFGCGL